MNTGVVDIANRTFDLGIYDETDASLNINSTSVTWTYRKEGGDLIQFQKSHANPSIGVRGDYLVSSPCKEVPEPFSIQGHYPLYMAAHTASAAGGGTGSHTHTLNGQTYYMPNGGTIYHGDYVPTDTYQEIGGFMQISKQETKTKPCIGKLLAGTDDQSKFTSRTFYDHNGVQRTALLVPVAM